METLFIPAAAMRSTGPAGVRLNKARPSYTAGREHRSSCKLHSQNMLQKDACPSRQGCFLAWGGVKYRDRAANPCLTHPLGLQRQTEPTERSSPSTNYKILIWQWLPQQQSRWHSVTLWPEVYLDRCWLRFAVRFSVGNSGAVSVPI